MISRSNVNIHIIVMFISLQDYFLLSFWWKMIIWEIIDEFSLSDSNLEPESNLNALISSNCSETATFEAFFAAILRCSILSHHFLLFTLPYQAFQDCDWKLYVSGTIYGRRNMMCLLLRPTQDPKVGLLH